MLKFVFLLFCSLCTYAQDIPLIPFQEQTPLRMQVPNEGKNHHARWLAISTDPQEVSKNNPNAPAKTIDESIKIQIQKRMETLLKPLDNEDEH